MECSQWSFFMFPLTIWAKAIEQNFLGMTNSFRLDLLTQFILWKRKTRAEPFKPNKLLTFQLALVLPFFLSFHHACDLTKSLSRGRNIHHSMFMWDFSLQILQQAVSGAACYNHSERMSCSLWNSTTPKNFILLYPFASPSLCLPVPIVQQKIWSCISKKLRRK